MSIAGEPTSVTTSEPTNVAAGGSTYVEEMTRLNELYKSGTISEKDYNKAKFNILERERHGGSSAVGGDEIGVGRYILSFVIAGFIGLGVAYFLRKEGWTAIWVNLGIAVVIVALYLMI